MADTRFSSSFIPKTPVVGATMQKERMGIMTALGGFVFVLSLLSIGGVFAYRKIIENKIADLQQELTSLEAQVNRQEIARLASFDKKLESAREVLVNHVALTNFFKMLEKNTLPVVSFTNLKYSAPSGKNISVSMDGFTTNYRILGEQQRALLAEPNTASVDFKTMAYDKTKRQTTFILSAEFNKALAKYPYPTVATSTSNSVPATTTPASSATTTKPAATTTRTN